MATNMPRVQLLPSGIMCNIYPPGKLERMANDSRSCVTLIKSSQKVIGVHPYYMGDILFGIRSTLYSNLKKYDPSLSGIALGFDSIRVIFDEKAGFVTCAGYILYNIVADFFVFQPVVGAQLKAVVKRKGRCKIIAFTLRYFKVIIRRDQGIAPEDNLFPDIRISDVVTVVVTDVDYNKTFPVIEARIE